MIVGWRNWLMAGQASAAWLDRRVLAVAGVLIAVDVWLVLFHAARFISLRYQLDAGMLLDPGFGLSTQGGYAELANHLKALGLIGLLVGLARASRETAYLAFAGLFVLVLIDDATGLDQPLGALAVRILGLPDVAFGIKAQLLGELVVFAAIGTPLAIAVARVIAGTGRAHLGPVLTLLVLTLMLALFAIVVDLVHITYIRAFYGAQLVLEVLEEGGEMVILSLALSHTLAIWLAWRRNPGRPETMAA